MRLFYLFFSIGIALLSINPAVAKHKTFKHVVTPRIRHTSSIAVASTIQGPDQLIGELNRLINYDGAGASVAVYVKSMKNGEMLYSRNIYHPLTPASTLKIFTAEAALLFLGPEYRFSTQLITDAKGIRNGILQGNLYVVLSGDPSLTYYDLIDLLMTLKSHQIQAIAGNVYIDNSAYDQSFYGPGWIGNDKKYCYAAPISASIINHNCMLVRGTPLKVSGRATRLLSRAKYSYPTVSSVVTDIPEYNRALFKNLLNQQAINVYGTVTFGSAAENLSLIGSHNSKPLRLLINDMLKKSDNVIAGALFKKVGQLYNHQPGSWQNASVAVSQILAKKAGVNISGLRILDGSGLSPDNLATPAQMMQVLDYAYHNYSISYEFVSALPIAGVDGTLKHRMGNIARKIRAKTGTISGVVSLAGYALSSDKEPLGFVIMINGNKTKSWAYKGLEDKIATALTRYRRSG